MSKLLYANLSRLKKDTFLWFVTIAALPVSSAVIIVNYVHYLGQPQTNYFGIQKTFYFDEYYFIATLALPLLAAVVISVFVGRDFSERTLRNKLISGHSHASVYLSNLVTGFFAALLIYAAMLLGGLVAIPLSEPTLLSGNVNVLTYVIIGIFAALACASVATLINMALGNRLAALIASMLLFAGILVLFVPIANQLAVSEFRDDFHFVDGILTVFPNAIANENYVGGTERTVWECILEFFPSGNMLMMYKGIIANPIREIILSLSFTAATSAGGIYLFKRKDLK